MRKFLQTAAVMAMLALAGCSSETSKPDTSGGATPPAGGESSGSSTSPYSAPGAPATSPYGTGGATGGKAMLPTTRLVHFDLDKSEIRPEDSSTIEAWAKYLSATASAKVRLEGHCDERGTREYNIGLGERRANAVQQALTSRGVSAKQLSVISYGEERPLAMGHDEGSWSQNRRVEITGQ